MTNNNRVIVAEDDPYAREEILNLLSRDWRTRVAAEFDSFSKKAFHDYLNDPVNKTDAIILDTEVPWDPNWPIEAFEVVAALDEPPKLIFLCTVPVPRYWNDVLMEYDFFGGYLLKQEVLYSLATAVSLVVQGKIVITESIFRMPSAVHLKKGTLIIDGTRAIRDFTPREQEILRHGILNNHSQRDIEDELVISRNWISEVLSTVYDKLQLKEILSNEIALSSIFSDKAVLEKAESILNENGEKSEEINLRKAPWLTTLAFHLLTIPEVRSVR